MLVAPRLPQSALSPTSDDSLALQHKPSKDLESFNSLLPPPVEFIEGSSSSSLAVAEGKYEPINASKSSKLEVSSFFSVLPVLNGFTFSALNHHHPLLRLLPQPHLNT